MRNRPLAPRRPPTVPLPPAFSGTSASPSTKTSGPAPTSSSRAGLSLLLLALFYWLIDIRRLNDTPSGQVRSSGPGSSSAPTPSPPSSSPTSSSRLMLWIKVPVQPWEPTRQTHHSLALDLPPPLRPPPLHQHHLARLRPRLRRPLLPPQLAPLAQTHLPQNLRK